MAQPPVGRSKYASVNLNNSYGRPASQSRPQSRPGPYGGMLVLGRGRPGGVLPHKGSRLVIPKPVNLPSLKREHAGNDPTVLLVGGSGGGWSKQEKAEEKAPVGAAPQVEVPLVRSALTSGSTWGGGTFGPSEYQQASPQPVPLAQQKPVRPGVYTPPAARGVTSTSVTITERVVVLRGEDFPSLQATTPVLPQVGRYKDGVQRPLSREGKVSKEREGVDEIQQVQVRQVVTTEVISTGQFQSHSQANKENQVGPRVSGESKVAADSGNLRVQQQDRSNQRPERPSDVSDSWRAAPSVAFANVSPKRPSRNWADDERDSEPLSRSQDHAGLDRNYDGKGRGEERAYGRQDDGSVGRSAHGRPHSGGQGAPFSGAMAGRFDGHHRRGPEDSRGQGTYSSGRNQDFAYSNGPGRYGPARGWDNSSRFEKGPMGRHDGQGFMSGRNQFGASRQGNRGQYVDDLFQDFMPIPFTSARRVGIEPPPPTFSYEGRPVRRKKEEPSAGTYRDAEREAFEAELERLQKQKEMERQHKAEEEERAVEMARLEQEARERQAREEAEARLRAEQEAREAALRVQREADELVRKQEDERRAVQEEKRRLVEEEEQRRENARRKLVELEERIARREAEKRAALPDSSSSEPLPDHESQQQQQAQGSPEEAGTWEDDDRLVKGEPFLSRPAEDLSAAPFDVRQPIAKASQVAPSWPSLDGHRDMSSSSNSRWMVDGGGPDHRPLSPAGPDEWPHSGRQQHDNFSGGDTYHHSRLGRYPEPKGSFMENGDYGPRGSYRAFYEEDDLFGVAASDSSLLGRRPYADSNGPSRRGLNRPDRGSAFDQQLNAGHERGGAPPPPGRPLDARDRRWQGPDSAEPPRSQAGIRPRGRHADGGPGGEGGDAAGEQRFGGRSSPGDRNEWRRPRSDGPKTDAVMPLPPAAAPAPAPRGAGAQAQAPPNQWRAPVPQGQGVRPGDAGGRLDNKRREGPEPQRYQQQQQQRKVEVPAKGGEQGGGASRAHEAPKSEGSAWDKPLLRPFAEVARVESRDAAEQVAAKPVASRAAALETSDARRVEQPVLEREATPKVQAGPPEKQPQPQPQPQSQGKNTALFSTVEQQQKQTTAVAPVEVGLQDKSSMELDANQVAGKPEASIAKEQRFMQGWDHEKGGRAAEKRESAKLVPESGPAAAAGAAGSAGTSAPPGSLKGAAVAAAEDNPLSITHKEPHNPLSVPFDNHLAGNQLFPGPVPAIQIGSFQMPLQFGPLFGQFPSSSQQQQPVLHFGQLGQAATAPAPAVLQQSAAQQEQQARPQPESVGGEELQGKTEGLPNGRNAWKKLGEGEGGANAELQQQQQGGGAGSGSGGRESVESSWRGGMRPGAPGGGGGGRRGRDRSMSVRGSLGAGSEASAGLPGVGGRYRPLRKDGLLPAGGGGLPQELQGMAGYNQQQQQQQQQPVGTGRGRGMGAGGPGVVGRGRGRANSSSAASTAAAAAAAAAARFPPAAGALDVSGNHHHLGPAFVSEVGTDGVVVRTRPSRRVIRRREEVPPAGSLDGGASSSSVESSLNLANTGGGSEQSALSTAASAAAPATATVVGPADAAAAAVAARAGAGAGAESVGIASEDGETSRLENNTISSGGSAGSVGAPAAYKRTGGGGGGLADEDERERGADAASNHLVLLEAAVEYDEEGRRVESEFIEVRSKRQMLNDRREQREKELKAKTRDPKGRDLTGRKRPAHKSTASTSSAVTSASTGGPKGSSGVSESRQAQAGSRTTAGSGDDNSRATSPPAPSAGGGGPALSAAQVSGLLAVPGLAPAPIGAPAAPSAKAARGVGEAALADESGEGTPVAVAWGGSRTSFQVVSLTQIQLEESIKPHLGGSQAGAPLLDPSVSAPAAAAPAAMSGIFSAAPIQFAAAGGGHKTGGKDGGGGGNSSSRSKVEVLAAAAAATMAAPPPHHHQQQQAALPRGPAKTKRARPEEAQTRAPALAPAATTTASNSTSTSSILLDAEAERQAEAAASAVAAAAISSDESVGSTRHEAGKEECENEGEGEIDLSRVEGLLPSDADAFPEPRISPGGVAGRAGRAAVEHEEDSMASALPADLSLDPAPATVGGNGSPTRQGGPASLGQQRMPGMPNGGSPFPSLDALGGSMFPFSLGQTADAAAAAAARAGLGGWAAHPAHSHSHSRGGLDSFYGAPAFPSPFLNPAAAGNVAGGLQAPPPPPVLLYNNPFGQLGMGYLPAYLPTGKQPDWKHTPSPAPPSPASMVGGPVDMQQQQQQQQHRGGGGGVRPVMGQQQQQQQRMAPGPAGLSLGRPGPHGAFDPNLSAPFQVGGVDGPAPWGRISGLPQHGGGVPPSSGPLLGFPMQPMHHMAPPQHSMGVGPRGRPLHAPHSHSASPYNNSNNGGTNNNNMGSNSGNMPPPPRQMANDTYSTSDAAAQFPDELGLGDSSSPTVTSLGPPPMGGGGQQQQHQHQHHQHQHQQRQHHQQHQQLGQGGSRGGPRMGGGGGSVQQQQQQQQQAGNGSGGMGKQRRIRPPRLSGAAAGGAGGGGGGGPPMRGVPGPPVGPAGPPGLQQQQQQQGGGGGMGGNNMSGNGMGGIPADQRNPGRGAGMQRGSSPNMHGPAGGQRGGRGGGPPGAGGRTQGNMGGAQGPPRMRPEYAGKPSGGVGGGGGPSRRSPGPPPV